MKLTDYIAQFLVGQGVKHVFLITGSAMVHMIDSLGRTDGIEFICVQHEQAAAMAADAYSRITGNIGVCATTSGPGATNLITGTCCSYYDSIPVLCLTGQVPMTQVKDGYDVRQIGFQETDVVSVFESITKLAVRLDKPMDVRATLELAVCLAKHGRPGPVLVDIPDDVQRAEIDADGLAAMPDYQAQRYQTRKVINPAVLQGVVELVKESQRPVVILGNGVRLAHAEDEAIRFVESMGFPVALTWAVLDMLPHNYPLNIGNFGVTGERGTNFAVQNADLILAVGTRLDTHEVGNDASLFARGAKKIIVDIDWGELDKYPSRGMVADVLVEADVWGFISAMASAIEGIKMPDVEPWLTRIREWRARYPLCPPEYHRQKRYVNPYVFMEALSEQCGEGDIVITDAGATLTWTMQGFRCKRNQRLFSAFNHSPMGYAFPAAIGAAFACGHRVICTTGDGGFQMNIQELATVVRHNLPIKIFVLDNRGYGMVRQTQDTWLGSRYYATSEEGGLALPDLMKIARAYGIDVGRIRGHKHLADQIKYVLNYDGPVLCCVDIDPKATIVPKVTVGRPLEDSAPLLDREEFRGNMIVGTLGG